MVIEGACVVKTAVGINVPGTEARDVDAAIKEEVEDVVGEGCITKIATEGAPEDVPEERDDVPEDLVSVNAEVGEGGLSSWMLSPQVLGLRSSFTMLISPLLK